MDDRKGFVDARDRQSDLWQALKGGIIIWVALPIAAVVVYTLLF